MAILPYPIITVLSAIPTRSCTSYYLEWTTAWGHRMAHRKWKETKLQPGTAGPGNMLGCCFVSFHFLWAIICLQAVIAIYIVGVNYQSRWVDTIRHALQWVSDRKSAESEENRTDDAQAAAWFTLARLWVASWAAGVNYVIQTSSWDLVRLHESVVRSTEKIKVQRLQPRSEVT